MLKNTLLAGILCCLTWPATAKEVDYLGTFGDWRSVAVHVGSEKTCFMLSEPLEGTAAVQDRGPAFLMVARHPGRYVTSEVSVIFGYQPGTGSDAGLVIDDGRRYRLFVEGDTAWPITEEDDREIVEAVTRGQEVVVSSAGEGGRKVVDRFSLRGSMGAHNAITAGCSSES